MIAFDIDGIVLNSHILLIEEVNKVMGTNLTVDDWDDYDIAKKVGMKEEAFVEIYTRVLSRDDIDRWGGTTDTLRSVYKRSGKPVLFVTAREGLPLQAAVRNIQRMAPYGGLQFEVLNGGGESKKDVLLSRNVKFFMEDNPKYWREYIDAGIVIGTFPHAWCKKALDKLWAKQIKNKMLVFENWWAVLDYVEKLPWETLV